MTPAPVSATSIETLIQNRSDEISLVRLGAIGLLIINRPAARNALRREDRRTFSGLVAQAEADPRLRALIVAGAGGHFCAGVDIKEPPTSGFVRPNPGEALRSFSKISIAAVDGACIGGGLEIALSCSFIIASDRAYFADMHAKRGILPAWGMSILLPDAVGDRRAREMSATGRMIDATEALAWGLANRLFPADMLWQECLGIAETAARFDPQALDANLELITMNADRDAKDAFESEAVQASKFKQARQGKGAEE